MSSRRTAPKRTDSPISYDDESRGRWVTIGAGKGEGSGGARVFIRDGKIEKGPPGTKGNSPSDPKAPASSSRPSPAPEKRAAATAAAERVKDKFGPEAIGIKPAQPKTAAAGETARTRLEKRGYKLQGVRSVEGGAALEYQIGGQKIKVERRDGEARPARELRAFERFQAKQDAYEARRAKNSGGGTGSRKARIAEAVARALAPAAAPSPAAAPIAAPPSSPPLAALAAPPARRPRGPRPLSQMPANVRAGLRRLLDSSQARRADDAIQSERAAWRPSFREIA